MSRFRFVETHHRAFSVKRLCRIVNVSRSGFYRWRKAAPARAARAADDARLAARIRKIHAESGHTYGSARVHAELQASGTRVNRKRVEPVMREHRIVGRHHRRRCRTTVPDPVASPVPDLLRRDFTAPRLTPVGWVTSRICRWVGGECIWPP